MKTTITRLFTRYDDAEAALQDLVEAGVPREDIAMVCDGADGRPPEAMESSQVADSAGAGAGIGGVLGGSAGLLAGLGMIAVPGLAPVVAAGWLAATAAGAVAGAAAGAAAGGVVGALMESGLGDPAATIHAGGTRKGGTLLTIRIDDSAAAEIRALLDSHVEPLADQDRCLEWRSSPVRADAGEARPPLA